MVHPLQACLTQAAGGAHPGLLIHQDGLGLYATDEEKHDKTRVVRFMVQGSRLGIFTEVYREMVRHQEPFPGGDHPVSVTAKKAP